MDPAIHLIAHSMGIVPRRALERLGESAQSGLVTQLREVAMMAPDIDADLFRQAAGRMAASAERVTLYASSQDSALKMARSLVGYPRAGDGGENIVVVPGIETVDASRVQTGILGLGHCYYADNTTILSDLFALIRGRRPEDRFGSGASVSGVRPLLALQTGTLNHGRTRLCQSPAPREPEFPPFAHVRVEEAFT